MASIIRIKRSGVSGNPSTLAAGEIAYSSLAGTISNGGDRLYVGTGTETNGDAANHEVIGGKYFTDKLDHALGTLTANSAILVDADSKIDQLLSGNIEITGSTDTIGTAAGDLTIAPTGDIDVNNNLIKNLATPTTTHHAATKAYVDGQIVGNTNLTIVDSSGTEHVINIVDSDLNILGDGHNITTTILDDGIDKQIIVGLNDTTVTANQYGSATAIPIITVDQKGRLTDVSTANVATTLSLAGDSSTTESISLIADTLTFSGDGIVKVLAGVTTDQVDISVALASTSGVGVASFDAADFGVDGSGDVSLDNAVVKSVTTDTGALTPTSHGFSILGGEGVDVTHTGTSITVAGEDATTSNKGVASFDATDFTVTSGAVAVNASTLGDTALNPGATVTDLTGLTNLVVDNIQIDGNTISSTDGSNTLYIDPAPVDSNGGDLIVRGNLVVQGVTTTINSTTMSVNDLNLVLADSATGHATADGAGITIGGALYTDTKPTLLWDGSNERFDFNHGINVPDSIGGLNTVYFNDVKITEAIEDHLVNNLLLAGEGIDLTYDDNGNTLTVAAELATLTNPGVGAFGGYADGDSASAAGTERQFEVSASGNVWIAAIDGGTY